MTAGKSNDPNKKNTVLGATDENSVPSDTSVNMPAVSVVSDPAAGVGIYDNPTVKPTDGEMNYIYGQFDVDPSGEDTYYHLGGYTQNRDEALAHGAEDKTYTYFDGTEGWYYMPGEKKTGANTPDETFMSDADWELSQKASAEWFRFEDLKKKALADGNYELAAQYDTEQKNLNNMMNKVRAKYGYYGGVDGTRLEWLDKEETRDHVNRPDGVGGGSASGGSAGSSAGGANSDLKGALDAWQQAAVQQSNAQVDHAVQKAVMELQRALEDAGPRFKEQAESVARDERQALDNSALYAELRGDKGGIGREQYNSIHNAAAKNRLAVQQAQTSLAADTARQIADLRAQGEVEKASAALELTQTYLSQLVKLEQWAAEFHLSEAEFADSVARWKADYALDLQKLQIGQSQWQQEFAAIQNKQLASMGEALLKAGVMPTAAQLSAMGMTKDQADSYLILRQLEAVR